MRYAPLVAALALFAGPHACAQDGGALLTKSASVYAGLNSYSHTTSSTAYIRAGNTTRNMASAAEVRFKKPNRFFISIQSLGSGTTVYAFDGREGMVYTSRVNQYLKVPAQGTPLQVLSTLNRAGASTFGVAFTAVLDPVYFILGNKLPPGVNWTAGKEPANLDGVACWKVEGAVGAGKGGANEPAHVTFWIDKTSGLLRKTQIETKANRVVYPAPPKGKPIRRDLGKQVTFTQTMTERIQDAKPNPPLDDAAFRYTPPKGAVEHNPGKFLGKQ